MAPPFTIVTNSLVEGGPTGEFSVFERTAGAYAAAGLWQRLGIAPAAAVTAVDGLVTADPIERLGQIGAATAAALAPPIAAGQRTLLVGGACHACVGALAGLQAALGTTVRIGLVWFDAHGDFNTPRTTLTGRLSGMPVAVAAGLAHPRWRSLAGQQVVLPTDRIVMVDVRNLDPPERHLVQATDVAVVPLAPEFRALQEALDRLTAACDVLYLHVDADVLDRTYVPNHPTAEPDGPSLALVTEAIGRVLASGKVVLGAVVSVNPVGEGGDVAVRSGAALVEALVHSWPSGH